LAWSIGLTAILAAILSAAIVWLVEREHAGEEWVRHSRAVHNQIAQLLLVVQRMESSQRSYLLTGRDIYLSNYNNAEKELPALIDEAGRLVADDNHRQQETFAELRQVAFEKMRELRAAVGEQQAGRPDGALAIVKSDGGLSLMDQLRQLFAEMKNEEDRVLSNRLSALGRVGTLLQVGAVIPFLLIGAIGVLTRLYIRRSLLELTVALRQRAQNQSIYSLPWTQPISGHGSTIRFTAWSLGICALRKLLILPKMRRQSRRSLSG
jgi:CHASE3 domain sensor protein